MNTALTNKIEFDHVCKMNREAGIKYQKKWFCASCISPDGRISHCNKKYEDLGFVNLCHEYTEGVLYPCEKVCQDCQVCNCRIIFKVEDGF